MLTPEAFAETAQRFEFERWAGNNALGRGLLIRNYRVPLPRSGWELVRAWNVPSTADSPPAMQTMWRNPAAGPDALLRVDVYECASRRAAHEQVLELLGHHELTNVTPVETGGLGDVHAMSSNGEMAVFARGNLVIFVARAGTQATPATPVAEELDADIIHEPEQEAQPQHLDAAALSAIRRVPLAAETAAFDAGAGPPTMVKIFTDGLEPALDAGDVAFDVSDAAAANVVVYEIPATDGPSRESIAREQEREEP